MNLFKSLLDFDQKIVDHLESFCHWQQRLLGMSHYSWLKLFAVAHAALFFVFVLLDERPGEHFVVWLPIIALLVCVPGFTWWERKSLNRLLKGFANPLRKNGIAIYFRYTIGYICTTYFVTGMIIANLIDPTSFWLCFMIIIWWVTSASLYVLPVCDPLPPVTGKWKEWLAGLLLKSART